MNIASSNTTQPVMKGHFYWLDIFRGIAAFSVLIWHYQHFYYPKAGLNGLTDRSIQPFYHFFKIFYKYGGSAVPLFWVISGFVFATAYIDKPLPNWKKFLVNRLSRLYPLHFITLIAVTLLQFTSLKIMGEFQIYRLNDLYHFILNLFMASYWGLQKGYSFNAPIWSVSIEILIYIVFFIFLPFLNRTFLKVVTSLVILFATSIITKSPIIVFSQCGMFFFLGCFVFYLWKRYLLFPKKLLFGSLLGIFSSLLIAKFFPKFIDSDLQHVALFPSIVMLTAALEEFDKLSLGKKGKILGDLSYGIYLWHIPIQLALIIWMELTGRSRLYANQPAFLALFVLLTLLISFVSFKYYELPMREKIRKRLN